MSTSPVARAFAGEKIRLPQARRATSTPGFFIARKTIQMVVHGWWYLVRASVKISVLRICFSWSENSSDPIAQGDKSTSKANSSPSDAQIWQQYFTKSSL